jgi:hypothetical protein
MKVGIQELIDALNRHTKMLRGPQGARGKGLKDAALVPAINGMWVYMPGGRHFVVSLGGELKEEVLFEAKRLLSIRKALKSLLSKAQEIELVTEDEACVFVCDGSRIRIKRIN